MLSSFFVNSVSRWCDPGDVIGIKFFLLLVPVLTRHSMCVGSKRSTLGTWFSPSTKDCSSAFTHWAISPDLILSLNKFWGFFFFDTWIDKHWYHGLHEFPMHPLVIEWGKVSSYVCWLYVICLWVTYPSGCLILHLALWSLCSLFLFLCELET